MLRLLLSKGFEPNTQNFEGNTAMHYAIDAKFLKCVDLLINYGADENIVNNHGVFPWELLK